MERLEQEAKYDAFLKTLTPTQLRRYLLFEKGLSEREIATIEGVSYRSIRETREQLMKKFKEFFGYDPSQKRKKFSV